MPLRSPIFFHPDYTVGPGVSPGHAFRLAGCTAGGESHPALKILIQLVRLYASLSPLSRYGPSEKRGGKCRPPFAAQAPRYGPQNRSSITANWALVAVPAGLSVPALVPLMMPLAVAHWRASTA